MLDDFTSSGDPTQINRMEELTLMEVEITYEYSGDKADFDFLSSSADSSIFIVSTIDGTTFQILMATKNHYC